eukprot:9773971-Alexandrium_andersonii.AAC.1
MLPAWEASCSSFGCRVCSTWITYGAASVFSMTVDRAWQHHSYAMTLGSTGSCSGWGPWPAANPSAAWGAVLPTAVG